MKEKEYKGVIEIFGCDPTKQHFGSTQNQLNLIFSLEVCFHETETLFHCRRWESFTKILGGFGKTKFFDNIFNFEIWFASH